MPAYIFWFNRRTGNLKYKEYDSLSDTTEDRVAADRANHSPDVEIVTFYAKSLETLKSTHPRYFLPGCTPQLVNQVL